MKKIVAILLAAVLCLSLCACSGGVDTGALDDILSRVQSLEAQVEELAAQKAAEAEAAAQALEEAAAQAEAEADSEAANEIVLDAPVNVMVLNGPTGFGMAKLLSDANAGEASLDYNITVETDASNITAALISGGCDIAALPTNAASTVFNKTEGGIQVIALNTLGTLYVVVNTENAEITSLADLDGMTVYAPAQNPSFIFRAITQAAGLDVTVDNTYAAPADLRTALVSGEIDVAVLPEPMVTIALSSNENLAVAVDLNAAWNETHDEGGLVMGCAVVRTAFAEEHPDAVEAFLNEYGTSIAYLQDDPAAASELIAETGIFEKAPVALKAIPNCNVCFIAGVDMAPALTPYLQALYDLAPDSVGGAVPGEDFYFVG